MFKNPQVKFRCFAIEAVDAERDRRDRGQSNHLKLAIALGALPVRCDVQDDAAFMQLANALRQSDGEPVPVDVAAEVVGQANTMRSDDGHMAFGRAGLKMLDARLAAK